MRQLCAAILVALFLLSGAVQAVSAEQSTARTVRVGCVDIDNFLVVNQDGSLSGYGAEYLSEIGKQTGWQYEYVYGTWSKCMEWLRSGEIDLLFLQNAPRNGNRILRHTSECCIDTALLTASDNETLYYGDFARSMELPSG